MAKKVKSKTVSNSLDPTSSTGSTPPSTSNLNSKVPGDSAQDSSSSSGSTAALLDSTSSNIEEATHVDTELDTAAESGDYPDVTVNKWSLHELKTASDDAVKQYFSRPSQFKPSHTHTDVRLVLGWTSSLLALGASFYAYKVPFQQSRQWVLLAVLVFVVCSAVLGAYGKWIEKDTIFIGRRKVYAGRIETQSISISSNCTPYDPTYNLTLSYVHSSNAGKLLIRTAEKSASRPFGELFDSDGRLVRSKLDRLCSQLLKNAME